MDRIALQKLVYADLRQTGLSAQLCCSVLRSVAAAYVTREKEFKRRTEKARRKKRNLPERNIHPIEFRKQAGLFLIGNRGRDARFTKKNTISIGTVDGRQEINYSIPQPFRKLFEDSLSRDSLTVLLRNGKLEGKLALTIEVPEPEGKLPVGVDLNETNLIAAVDSAGRKFIYNGIPLKAKNKRARQVRKRLQKKLALLKAEDKDTHSVRRALNRLGSRISYRTTNECRTAAKKLTDWLGDEPILVLEELHPEKVSKADDYRKSNETRRRLNSGFPYNKLCVAIVSRTAYLGIPVEFINPYLTSQKCNRCGNIGVRNRHKFTCSCGNSDHADLNAAKNIRDKFVVLRCDGVPSVTPGAQSCGQTTTL